MLTYEEQVKQMAEGDAAVWYTPYVSTFEKVARIRGHQAGLEEGRQEGRQEGLRSFLDKQVRRRFPHTVTAKHLHLINDADVETLSLWGEKLIDADKVEDVFEK